MKILCALGILSIIVSISEAQRSPIAQFSRIGCTHGSVIPHPTDCSSFIKCGFNDIDNVILQCKFPHLYNTRISQCDFPANVACRMFTWVARPFVPRNEVIPKQVISCSEGWLLPHASDCNKFLQCGKRHVDHKTFICPTSLLYNPNRGACDLPQNVDCRKYNYEIIPDLGSTSTSAPQQPQQPQQTMINNNNQPSNSYNVPNNNQPSNSYNVPNNNIPNLNQYNYNNNNQQPSSTISVPANPFTNVPSSAPTNNNNNNYNPYGQVQQPTNQYNYYPPPVNNNNNNQQPAAQNTGCDGSSSTNTDNNNQGGYYNNNNNNNQAPTPAQPNNATAQPYNPYNQPITTVSYNETTTSSYSNETTTTTTTTAANNSTTEETSNNSTTPRTNLESSTTSATNLNETTTITTNQTISNNNETTTTTPLPDLINATTTTSFLSGLNNTLNNIISDGNNTLNALNNTINSVIEVGNNTLNQISNRIANLDENNREVRWYQELRKGINLLDRLRNLMNGF